MNDCFFCGTVANIGKLRSSDLVRSQLPRRRLVAVQVLVVALATVEVASEPLGSNDDDDAGGTKTVSSF
jgi:hypothetical protein